MKAHFLAFVFLPLILPFLSACSNVSVKHGGVLSIESTGDIEFPAMFVVEGERAVHFDVHALSGPYREGYKTFVLLKRTTGRLLPGDFQISYAPPPSTDYQRCDGSIEFKDASITIDVTLLGQGAGAGRIVRYKMVEINGTYAISTK